MKINEVLTKSELDEGVADFVQGLYGAGKQIKQASQQQAAITKQVTNTALQKWGAVSQNLKSSGQPIDTDAVVNWFSNFINGKPTSSPAGVNPNQIRDWLTKEISNYIVQKEIAQKQPTTTYKKGEPATSTAGADLSLAPAGANLTDPQAQNNMSSQNPLGITVIRATDQGHILQYGGRKYWPNNRGEWAINGRDAPAAVASAQLQAEMDKAAGL